MESTIVRLKRQLSGSTAGSTLLLSVDLLSLIGQPALSTRERLLEQREMLPIFAWTLLKVTTVRLWGKKKSYLRFVRQPVVVLGLGVLLFAQFLPDPSDLLRWFPQRETLGVMAQVKLLPIEYRAHVARITRVETHPGDVRCGSERLESKSGTIINRHQPQDALIP